MIAKIRKNKAIDHPMGYFLSSSTLLLCLVIACILMKFYYNNLLYKILRRANKLSKRGLLPLSGDLLISYSYQI